MNSRIFVLIITITVFAALDTVATGQSPQGIPAADFNGDGKLDRAVANDGSDTVPISTVVELNPSSLAFGTVMLGRRFTLTTVMTNVGKTTLHITSITSSDVYFSESNSCGSSLPPEQSCDIFVTFAPRVLGMWNGRVSISDDGVASPQQVSLSGTGVQTVNCHNYSCFGRPHCPPGCYCHNSCEPLGDGPLGDGPVGELLRNLSPMTSFVCDATRQFLHLDDGVH